MSTNPKFSNDLARDQSDFLTLSPKYKKPIIIKSAEARVPAINIKSKQLEPTEDGIEKAIVDMFYPNGMIFCTKFDLSNLNFVFA